MKSARIHLGGILAYGVVFAFAMLNLAAPPGNWPFYVILLLLAVVILVRGQGPRWISWALILVAVAMLVLEVVSGKHLAGRLATPRLHREIQSLAIGTSAGEVKSFLRQREIEHSYNEPDRRAHAIIRNAGGGLFTSRSITFVLSFDEAERLTNVQSGVVHTGP